MGRRDCGCLGLGEDSKEHSGPVQVPRIEGVAGRTACSFAINSRGEGYAILYCVSTLERKNGMREHWLKATTNLVVAPVSKILLQ